MKHAGAMRGPGKIVEVRVRGVVWPGWQSDDCRRMKAPMREGETYIGLKPGKPDVPGGCALSCR
jgi:hypothetical protein